MSIQASILKSILEPILDQNRDLTQNRFAESALPCVIHKHILQNIYFLSLSSPSLIKPQVRLNLLLVKDQNSTAL
jgi:hypothetical protein